MKLEPAPTKPRGCQWSERRVGLQKKLGVLTKDLRPQSPLTNLHRRLARKEKAFRLRDSHCPIADSLPWPSFPRPVPAAVRYVDAPARIQNRLALFSRGPVRWWRLPVGDRVRAIHWRSPCKGACRRRSQTSLLRFVCA